MVLRTPYFEQAIVKNQRAEEEDLKAAALKSI